MNVNINKNIVKYRKEFGVTQQEFAKYLNVSPQAVSKWEQGASMPDVTLLPKIACFFNISIDTLFGVNEIDTVKLLVSKYAVMSGSKNYRDAKDVIYRVLDHDDSQLDVLMELSRLEFFHSIQCLKTSMEKCMKILDQKNVADSELIHRVKVQMIRNLHILKSMGAECDFNLENIIGPDASSFEKDYYQLIMWGTENCFESIMEFAQSGLEEYKTEERLKLTPLIMEAALALNDMTWIQKCFEFIICNESDTHQIFNAWWLLWMAYKQNGQYDDAEQCRDKLLQILPEQSNDYYAIEQLKQYLYGNEEKIVNVF